MSRRKQFDYESAMPDEEVSWRMGSSAGRKLQKRLQELDLLDTGLGGPPSTEVTDT